MPAPEHVIVVGAGVGGLAAAIDLARQGVAVTVLERAPTPGGKLRQVFPGGVAIDAGPTVFTLRWVFDELFADSGSSLSDHLTLTRLDILARHAWSPTERLDLFADSQRNAAEIANFAGSTEANGYLRFAARARKIYETLETPFLRGSQPGSPLALVRRAGVADMLGIAAFSTMWNELGRYFRDPRLRQLFGRYATYCGSSPFLAPATLMLIAHVEQAGVWAVEGGMYRLAQALAELAAKHGATLRYNTETSEILASNSRVHAVRLADGETLAADAIIVNADAAALAAGRFGHGVRAAIPPQPTAARSLSALTWAATMRANGFPLVRHNVFFGPDYAGEFTDIFRHGRLPSQPTIYVCAQDRTDTACSPGRPERLFILVNAPPTADRNPIPDTEIQPCATQLFSHLAKCGLHLSKPEAAIVTGPTQFEAMFPATGGALYGQATHGTMASFRRPGSRTAMPGLYLAGGSAHPGAGVPMAALSGRQAARSLMADWRSTDRSPATATRGGMSMR